jgi:HEPN domain-containing protein
MNRNDFKRLAGLRLAESRRLLDSGHHEGAFYLAGYAVEWALKACYASKTKRFDFPPEQGEYRKAYSHELSDLATIAGVRGDLEQAGTKTAANWNIVRRWSHLSRYGFFAKKDAEELISAVADRTHGVLACIRKHW